MISFQVTPEACLLFSASISSLCEKQVLSKHCKKKSKHTSIILSGEKTPQLNLLLLNVKPSLRNLVIPLFHGLSLIPLPASCACHLLRDLISVPKFPFLFFACHPHNFIAAASLSLRLILRRNSYCKLHF